MRRLLICALIVGFLALPVIYSTAKGYTVWYWRSPHMQIFVNGRRVPGYVHESKHGLIITRGDLLKRRSYIVSFLDNGDVSLLDCSPWTASDLPVVVIRDVNPPCLTNLTNSETPEGPWGPVRMHRRALEFATTNNNVIRIVH